MGYKIRETIAGRTKEIEKYYDYRDNRGNETRIPKKEISAEAKLLANIRQAEKTLRRLMNANFNNDSWYLTMDCIKEAGADYVTPDEMKHM